MIFERSAQRDRYEVIRLSGRRPILALPLASRSVRLAALDRYMPFTPRRAFFRYLLRVIVATGFDRVLFRPTTDPLLSGDGFDLDAWLADMRSRLGVDLTAAIVWPKQESRARVYVHLMRGSGEAMLFAKLGFDERNAASLRAEAQAIRSLNSRRIPTFRAPQFQRSGEFGHAFYVLYDAIPSRADKTKPEFASVAEWVATLGSPSTLSGTEAHKLTWWAKANTAAQAANNPHFETDVSSVTKFAVCIRPVHGDLGIHNVIHAAGAFWLLDWEEFCCDGPCYCDEIAFYMSIRRRRILSNPKRGCMELLDCFEPAARRDLALATAFLAANGNDVAAAIAKNWPPGNPTQ